jgi:hypothetical protein
MYIEIIFLPDVFLCVCLCVCVFLGIRNGIEVFLNLKILLSGFYQDIVNSKYQIHMYI